MNTTAICWKFNKSPTATGIPVAVFACKRIHGTTTILWNHPNPAPYNKSVQIFMTTGKDGIMKRGWAVWGILLTAVVFYATALQAAGMVVCRPIEQTVCTMIRPGLQFPVSVEGTNLRILRTVCYEGAFLENGGNTPVANVLGILVENTGESHISTAWIMLSGGGERWLFMARDLPAGSRTILLETGGALWKEGSFLSACGGAETAETDLLAGGKLEITDVDLGSVAVTNLSDESFFNLELTYKNYLGDADIYQGGIAYHYTLPVLRPGQTITIDPERYASGYSRFVYAITE